MFGLIIQDLNCGLKSICIPKSTPGSLSNVRREELDEKTSYHQASGIAGNKGCCPKEQGFFGNFPQTRMLFGVIRVISAHWASQVPQPTSPLPIASGSGNLTKNGPTTGWGPFANVYIGFNAFYLLVQK